MPGLKFSIVSVVFGVVVLVLLSFALGMYVSAGVKCHDDFCANRGTRLVMVCGKHKR